MQLMKNSTMNNSGFTLIELIISIAIISILLIAGVIMLSTTLVSISDEGKDTEALFQAQEVMGKIMAGETPNVESYDKIQWIKTNKTIDAVEGIYYEIKKKGTTKVLLKGFVLNE